MEVNVGGKGADAEAGAEGHRLLWAGKHPQGGQVSNLKRRHPKLVPASRNIFT